MVGKQQKVGSTKKSLFYRAAKNSETVLTRNDLLMKQQEWRSANVQLVHVWDQR